MNAFELRRALLAVPPPDELGAMRRSWRLARAAFDEREPTPWPKRHTRGLVAAAVAIAALAAAVSSPGARRQRQLSASTSPGRFIRASLPSPSTSWAGTIARAHTDDSARSISGHGSLSPVAPASVSVSWVEV